MFLDKDDGITWKNALYAIWLGYTTKTIISVDNMVVKTKRKIEFKNKDSKHVINIGQSMASPEYDGIELGVKKFNPNQQYDTEGNDFLLDTETNRLNHDDVNIQIEKRK